jgi:hypothetical protein
LKFPLVLRFQVVYLDDNPQYTALSYFWGQSLAPNTVVTTNLLLALRYLRPWRLGALWIDQLCIDQSCDEERSSQVALMKDIYTQTSQVVISRGEEKEAITKSEQRLGLSLLDHGGDNPSSKDGLLERAVLVDRPEHASAREGLQDVLERPWFTRKWVL